MDWFDATYFGNSPRAWLLAFVVGLAVFSALRIARALILRQFGAEPATDGVGLAAIVGAALRRTRLFFIAFVSLYAALQVLVLPPQAERALRLIGVVVIMLQAAAWGNVLITALISRQAKRLVEADAAAATTLNAVAVLARLLLWLMLVLLGLQNLGVQITPLLTGLGIGGIAVALAVQNVLGDLFASLSIVIDKPFVIGDFIIVGDLLGTVEHIGLKTTRVRSLSGEQLVFSNSDLLNSRIRNFKRMYHRRVVFGFGVTYQTPYEKVARIGGIVREIIEAQERTRFDRAHFKEYGDYALVYEVVYHVLEPDYNVYMDIQESINLAILRRFEDEGIDFAYPTQMLYMQQPA